jgi:hypothetical protein
MDTAPPDERSIEGDELTTWAVLARGTHLRMDFIGIAGIAHRIVLPFDALSSLLMTLPSMPQTALDARFPDGSLRFVHQLGTWRIEQAAAGAGLILQLCTPDGFEVAFALNDSGTNSLGAALTTAPGKYRSDIGRPH